MLTSVKTLLSSIVDYAGLFPPAQLDLRSAMVIYDRAQTLPEAWMLSRFVLPASHLSEFVNRQPTFSLPRWSVSVIFSQQWQAELAQIAALHHPAIAITALEFPPLSPSEIPHILKSLSTPIDCYFELPCQSIREADLSFFQRTGALAKIRTGGTTADGFPSTPTLCQAIFALAQVQVGFKATAGLHHPLSGSYRLTDEPQSPIVQMHGFLNVAIVAALIYGQKVSLEQALSVLAEPSIAHFNFTDDTITWRDHSLNLTEIITARHQFFRSFGSCSWQIPIADLQELTLL